MSGFDEYSLEAASSFLQTAVFIDANIYQKSTAQVRKVVRKTRKQTGVSKKTKAAKTATKELEGTEITTDDAIFDAYDIVNSFAKKQIVCSLYEPKKEASVSPKSDIFPLCKAADLVIVDWDLYGDNGKKARELISGLITQAVHDLPEQLRLIIIYTQEIDLFGKLNEVYEELHDEIQAKVEAPNDSDRLAFHASNIRVKILGKPGRTRPDVDQEDELLSAISPMLQ